MKINPLVRSIVIIFALGAFCATIVDAAEKQQAPKTSKPAKTKKKETPPSVKMGLEPKAVELLKAACGKLAAVRTVSFTAVVTYENPSRLGTPLAYTTKSEVTLQRPDKLRVITPGDGPASEFYYDGHTMTAFSPASNLAATATAPSTIDAMLKTAYDSAAIYFPFSDLIVADPYKDLSEGLVLAFYIGQSTVVGGTKTDMVAYADNDVFAQIWIGVEDKLPRMIRAVYRKDAARLRHQLEISNWQLDAPVPADAFVSKDAGKAKPIAFAHPNPPQSKADKTSVKGKKSKK